MASIPYMPFYVADYLSATSHLSRGEHGAYFLLIMAYWRDGKPLPADDRRLAKLAHATPEEWDDMKDTIADFFRIEGDFWHHDRIDEELSIASDKIEKARTAGKQSADARSAKKEQRLNKTATIVEQPVNECSTDVQQSFNYTELELDTEKNKENSPADAAADVCPVESVKVVQAPDPDKELSRSIEAAFISQLPGNRFTSYPREREQIKRIVLLAKSHAPDDPTGFSKTIIERYWQMRKSDPFYGKQPFTPSCLVSFWDRVLLGIENKANSMDGRRAALDKLGIKV